MKIRRGIFALSFTILVLAVLGIIGFFLNKKVTSVWEDVNTWSVQERVIVPSAAKDLKVTLSGDVHDGKFDFSSDYCLLYEITSDDTTSTLKCSLLPYYYVKRANEVAKDWKEKSDIQIVVTKEDPAPSEFLGRLDKSFESVSNLGTDAMPVSISFSGDSKKPEASLTNKVQHYMLVQSSKVEEIPVVITGFSVKRLDTATAKEKSVYATNWVKAVKSELEKDLTIDLKTIKTSRNLMNTLRTTLQNDALMCKGLSTCSFGYESNPAEKLMFYLYGLSKSNPEKVRTINQAMVESVYPFNGTRALAPASDESATVELDWQEMAAYNNPICPIAEVMSGKHTGGNMYFMEYVKNSENPAGIRIPNNDAEALKLLNAIPMKEFASNQGWTSDSVTRMNEACYYVLKNAKEGTQIGNKVVQVFAAMYSENIGTKTDLGAASLESIIYEMTAYSPYKSSLLLDYPRMVRREVGAVQKSSSAAGEYMELKSLINTLVVLYTYDSKN